MTPNTGTWSIVTDSNPGLSASTWRLGTTRRGRPPRDPAARRRWLLRRIVVLLAGWALAGAGLLRLLLGTEG